MAAGVRTVMWLRPMHEAPVANLRRSAETLGVAPHRLVFSVLERTPDYLARFRLADLVLDTYPYGSHTTTNDALFAGVPVVTVAGRTFAARASASQLATMGLHELIADDLDAYARLCDALITDPGRLAAVTGRVRADAARAALFDMQPYARKFVDAIFAGWRALAASRQDSARR